MAPSVVLMACGSFSPPTPMHFRLFEIARDYFAQMGSHTVVGGIMSPVHDSYKKQGLVAASHRCNMLRIGLQNSDWIRMSDWEIKQEGWTRTRMSLNFHQNYINAFLNDDLNGDCTDSEVANWVPRNLEKTTSGAVQVKLLCGADLLESFSVPNLWDPDDLEAILGQHGIVVISRSGSNPEQFIFNSDLLTRHRRNITLITNWVANEVSSTVIRKLMTRGQSVKYLLDDRIIDYIKNNSLFSSTEKSKFILSSPTTNDIYHPNSDGIVLKLNAINQKHLKPSPDEMMDETDHHFGNSGKDKQGDQLQISKPKVFCCGGGGANESSKTPANRRASRSSRRGPGQAVQIMTNGPRRNDSNESTTGDEVGLMNRKASTTSSSSPANKNNSICIISTAPNLSASATFPGEMVDHQATAQELLGGDAGRNYNDMIKFVFTEHGIKVISDKEYVV